MTILQADLKAYRSNVWIPGDAGNGGTPTETVIPQDAVQGVFQHIESSELSAGSTKQYKSFYKITNTDNLNAESWQVCLERPTSGGDRIYIWPGTFVDTETDTVDTTLYGTGTLQTTLNVSDTTIVVTLENADDVLFHDGDTIRISSQDLADSEPRSGTTEFLTVSGTPVVVGTTATITVSTGVVNGYTAGSAYVSSMIDIGDVKGEYSSVTKTFASTGTFDETQIVIDHQGSIYQTVTLTFTSSTAFTATSDVGGISLGTGDVSTLFQPSNPNGGTYFEIPPGAWGGTIQTGDEVEFLLSPPMFSIWERRVVPASTPSFASFTRRVVHRFVAL